MLKTDIRIVGDMGQPHSDKFQRSRHLPSSDLAFLVGYYWFVRWDLRGQGTYLCETLPQPCIHLVFEKNQSRIVGVMRKRFSYVLADTGRLLGVSFKPGAFFPFIRQPVSALTDASISFSQAFGAECATLEEAILAQQDEASMITLVERFLRERLPEQDEHITLMNQIVDRIIADREITRVDQLVSSSHLSKRTLQRLFRLYVGVNPKWVINRYRLQETAEQLTEGADVDWAKLALDLGYFDQAHFINDFRAIIGKTPAEYARQIRIDPSSFLTCDILRRLETHHL